MKDMELNIYPVRVDNLGRARNLLHDLGVTGEGIDIMAPKSQHYSIKAGPLSPQAAQILKQEMLSIGGEAAVHGDVLLGRLDTHVLLMGTLAQFRSLLPKLRRQPFRLVELSRALEEVINNISSGEGPRVLRCPRKVLQLGRNTLVMGILNVTPDSFSDGGVYFDPQAAIQRALEIESQGADILDIGAESTRPGAERVTSEEEISRLLPVLKGISREIKIPVSIDTYKASTARAALEAGADMINDVSGLQDPEMVKVIREYNVPLVLMHSVKGHVDDIIEDVVCGLRAKKKAALEQGIKEENIILDPGIGFGRDLFGKDVQQNLEIINHLDSLKCLGSPILVGTSRKSFISQVVKAPPQAGFGGTCSTVVASIMRGADIVRVHDVKETVLAARMTDAILGRGNG